MKKTLVLAIVAGMLLSLTGAAMAEPVTVGNFSFEEPCTIKLLNWENVPNWNSDPVATNSGVDTEDAGWVVPDGQWLGYLWNDDPSVYNLTDRTIATGDAFILTLDASNGYTGGTVGPFFKITLYYDNTGSRIPVASRTFILPTTDSTHQWVEYSIEFNADSVPASIGKKIGIEFENITTSTISSWVLMDNVRLERSLVSNPSPANHDTFVAVTTNLSWTLDPSVDKCDVYFGTDPCVAANPKVIDGVRQTSYNPPGDLDPEAIYFWRIDTYVGETLYEGGKVKWEFTTSPSGSPQADVYYINGTYGSDSNPGTLNEPWQTLDKANTKLQAGDTVYIREGLFSGDDNKTAIYPNNSGTANAYIKYAAYPGEEAVITGYGIYLPEGESISKSLVSIYNKSYIRIEGIILRNPERRWFQIESSDHIIFKDVTCDTLTMTNGRSFRCSAIYDSSYLYFENFYISGSDIYHEYDALTLDRVTSIVFYDSYFGNATHQAVGTSHWNALPGDVYIALINCTIENHFHTGLGMHGTGNHFLTQGCTFKNHGIVPDQQWQDWHGCGQGDPGHYTVGHRWLVRYNTFYNNSKHFAFRPVPGTPYSYNWFYHNTLYNTHSAVMEDCTPKFAHGTPVFSEMWEEGAGLSLEHVHFFNNILWKRGEDTETSRDVLMYVLAVTGNTLANNHFHDNIIGDPDPDHSTRIRWRDSYLNGIDAINSEADFYDNIDMEPSFVDPDADQPNFNLCPDSPAVDRGVPVTETTNSGANSTTLIVQPTHSYAFYSKEAWGHDWIPNPDIKSDLIVIGNSSPVRITNINYDTGVVTLAEDRSWGLGDPVYYCHNDESFSGSAPDIGAYEFTGVACFPIDQAGWSLWYVDSEETGYEAEKSFDGDPDTFWSTQWTPTSPPPPHEIQINLGGFYDICGFRYLPRQDSVAGNENGMIKDYEFYVSSDTADWGTAVASGTWAKDKTEKPVSFDGKLGNYVRLVALNEVENRPWTTMAELNVLAVQPDSDINNDGKVNIEDFAVLSIWWDDENVCSTPGWCGGADFNMSGTVDMSDLTYFAQNWLRQTD